MASLPQALPSSHVASVLCEHPSCRPRYQSSGLHHMQEMPAEANCAGNTYAMRTNSCRRGKELPCQCAKVVMWSCATLKQESPVCENRVWLAQFIVHQVHDCGQISLVAILQTRSKLEIVLLHNRQCVYRTYLLVSDFRIGLASICWGSGCDSSRRWRFVGRHVIVVCLCSLSRRNAVHSTRAWRSRPQGVIGVTETILCQNDAPEREQLSRCATNNQRSGNSQLVASLRVAQRSTTGHCDV